MPNNTNFVIDPTLVHEMNGLRAALYPGDEHFSPRWRVSGDTLPHTNVLHNTGGQLVELETVKYWRFEGQHLPLEVHVLVAGPDETVEGEGLTAACYGETWLLSGETRPHARVLREADFTWNGKLKSWVCEAAALPNAALVVMELAEPEVIVPDEMVKGNDLIAQRFDATWFVTGETRPCMSTFRKAGGRWDRKEKAWRFEGEALPAPVMWLIEAPCETRAGNKVTARRYAYGDAWLLGGETRPHMKVLRAAGATWDGGLKQWVLQGAELPDALAAIVTPQNPDIGPTGLMELAAA